MIKAKNAGFVQGCREMLIRSRVENGLMGGCDLPLDPRGGFHIQYGYA
jgi:hypothetical protein